MTTTPSSAENTVVLASGNRGKLRELSDLLNGLGITLRSQADFDVVEAEENGLSFIENAILKARNAARQTGFAALADDSGLCVDALGGAPGIYSARYAGANAQDADNNTKLLETLKEHSNRGAHFHCALAFVRHADDPAPLVCEGLQNSAKNKKTKSVTAHWHCNNCYPDCAPNTWAPKHGHAKYCRYRT